ncbi:uncharacterized protein EV154DRAFT_477781 [Mucor mucedo]|uniref:uncharacterized protein n=1 Tax=Mucor mucedo TaxID=29922 RepID=UPI00221F20DF|nr:uncharacterized protein EV154DRAFT_477781 [Mucor mucedo]KAI7895006.1 hypothetical protein EV154DRAFT_477781 [Mucor mucedo]
MSSLGTSPRPFLSLQKTYGILTKVQAGSAVVFSTFVVMHGAQIVSANVGGSSLANNWIMLGRPFYQDEHLEGLLVTGSALTHVAAGLAKLGIRLYWNKKTGQGSHLLPYHAATGYALIPLAGLHYYLVRHLPVDYYGDSSFIDFGYIAWGLQNKPVFTYGLHLALVVAGVYHSVSGIQVALGQLKKKKKPSHTKIPQHGKSVEQQKINEEVSKKHMWKGGLVATRYEKDTIAS